MDTVAIIIIIIIAYCLLFIIIIIIINMIIFQMRSKHEWKNVRKETNCKVLA